MMPEAATDDGHRAGPASIDRLAAIVDRAEIVQVVNDWGLFRDTGRWEALRALYSSDATMFTTWFSGSAERFVALSEEAARRGSRVQHFIGAATIEIAGDRAIAETRMVLLIRAAVGDVPVDVTCYGRFYDRFVREAGRWRIKMRVPIYEKDRIEPIDPGSAVPIDRARLATFAEGHRHVAYVQSLAGASLVPGLPTPHSPEERTLYAEGTLWLTGASPE